MYVCTCAITQWKSTCRRSGLCKTALPLSSEQCRTILGSLYVCMYACMYACMNDVCLMYICTLLCKSFLCVYLCLNVLLVRIATALKYACENC